MTELTQEELKALAVIAGKNILCIEGEELIVGTFGNPEYWQPHKDANQFEEVLFAVAEKYEILPAYALEGEDVVSFHIWNGVDMERIFSTRETYKAEVLRAVLKAVEE
jgi:hypothetical protein